MLYSSKNKIQNNSSLNLVQNVTRKVSNVLFGAVSVEAVSRGWFTCRNSDYWSSVSTHWWGKEYAFSRCVTSSGVNYYRALAEKIKNTGRGALSFCGAGVASNLAIGVLRVASFGIAGVLVVHAAPYQRLADKFEKSLWCDRGTATKVHNWVNITVQNRCNSQEVN